jgi:hypothetical protein
LIAVLIFDRARITVGYRFGHEKIQPSFAGKQKTGVLTPAFPLRFSAVFNLTDRIALFRKNGRLAAAGSSVCTCGVVNRPGRPCPMQSTPSADQARLAQQSFIEGPGHSFLNSSMTDSSASLAPSAQPCFF